MAFSNQMTRVLSRLDPLPGGLRWRAFSAAFGWLVPYVATSRVRIESLSESKAEVVIPNRRRVRNHVGGVHAAAVALLAETTSGLLVGRNVRDDCLPLIKTMKLDFVKRNHGSFRAVGTLDADQIEALHNTTKGETIVPVTLTDASGGEPVRAEMVWAWVPKKRREAQGTGGEQ